jgi:2-polyprenyl-3-methyl-5-hydroxy-6-metoxy-1,4-benzoquinol methylase
LSRGEWEIAFCPLCPAGTTAQTYLACGDRLREPGLSNYRLVKCLGCGLIYLSPRPLLAFAASHHKQDGYDPFLSFASPRNLFERIYLLARRWTTNWKRRLIIATVAPRGRVLDVGCGTGEFLASIADLYDVEGIEPEPDAARWGREKLGLKIHTGDLSSVQLGQPKFDLVTLWHALEHIPEPVDALRRIGDLVNPGGYLLVALPNIASFDARFYGSDWVAIDAPRHLWHFTPDTLARAAKAAGFEKLRFGALPLDSFYNILLSEKLHLQSTPYRAVISPFRMSYAMAGSLLRAAISHSPSGLYALFRK